MFLSENIVESALDSITAFAGGGQTSAVSVPGRIVRVATVATAADSVKLGVAQPGRWHVLINGGANAMQVFGSGTDTVNGVATATGVSQHPGSMVLYWSPTAGAWYTHGLNSGYNGQWSTTSFAGGLTAHAGGGQGSALPLTAMTNRITTVGTAADSVLLPPAVAGISLGPIVVVNAAAANALAVFPSTGDAINAIAVNTAFSVVANKAAIFFSTGAGQWHSVLTA